MAKHPAALAAVTLALGLAACLQAGPPAAAPLAKSPDGRRLTLTFSDDFNSFRRWSNGKGVWRTTFRDGKSDDQYGLRTLKWNKELELYVDPDMRAYGQENAPPLGLNPFRTQGGVLEISATRAPAELDGRLGGFRYISGLISSQPTFSQLYGYFEMRAKLPRGKGVWPAFWMLPADLDWPPEIDIMESVGDPSTVYVTAHSKVDKTQGQKVTVSPDSFHTYAVSWDPRQLIWFVDGKEVKRWPTPPDMHKPMYMLANIALGGDWAGAPDATTPFPARMSIDYIRAYRFAQ